MLLDAAVGFFPIFGSIAFLWFCIAVVSEWGVMTLMRFKSAKQSLVDALIVNFASTGFGFILFMSGFFYDLGEVLFYLSLPLSTILVEALIMSSNRGSNTKARTWIVAAVMNIVSYALIYLSFLIMSK